MSQEGFSQPDTAEEKESEQSPEDLIEQASGVQLEALALAGVLIDKNRRVRIKVPGTAVPGQYVDAERRGSVNEIITKVLHDGESALTVAQETMFDVFDIDPDKREAMRELLQPQHEQLLGSLQDRIDKAHGQDRPEKLEVLRQAAQVLGNERLAEVTVHGKEDRGGAESKEYTVPQAMKDAYEALESRRHELKSEYENIQRNVEQKKETEQLRDLLDYLNQARQRAEEVRGVYRHVIDSTAADSNREFPAFLKQRPDLAEQFDYGMDKSYKGEAPAAHDLIEFLAKEAEARIREIEGGEKDSPEKGEDTIPEGQRMVRRGETMPDRVQPKGPEVLEVKDITPKPGEGKPEGGKEGVEIPSPESYGSKELDEARLLYLKAQRLRGNVFRGTLGRIFGRTLEFEGEKLDFGGPRDMERVRAHYDEKLSATRKSLIEKRAEQLRDAGVSPEEIEAKMQEFIITLISKEQELIDDTAETGIEKGRLAKMKEWWKEHKLTRLFGGGALVVAGATGVGGAVVGGARAVLGGVGTYIGVEAGLERTKWIGHKGLVDKIHKDVGELSEDVVRQYIADLNFDDVQEEVARLRMLQVEKGVSLSQAGRSGDKTAVVARILFERERDHIANEVSSSYEETEEEQFADILSRRLSVEEDVRNSMWEDQTDREHVKKLGRKVLAAGAGGAMGWLVGDSLLGGGEEGGEVIRVEQPDRFGPDVPFPDEPPPVGPEEIGPDAGAPDAEVPGEEITPTGPSWELVVEADTDGDHLWGLIENKMDSDGSLGGLNAEQRTYVVDKMKDVFAALQEQGNLSGVGIGSGDIDLIQAGEQIDLSPALGDASFVDQALNEARNLSSEALQSIKENNTTIMEWARSHPDEFLTSEKVADILAGRG